MPPYEQYIGPRYKLVSTQKYQVVKVERGINGVRMHLKVGSATLTFDAPVTNADIRPFEDWLTLYVEVAMRKPNEP